MWLDNETDRDFINFVGIAESVAEIIKVAHGAPVSIGISGTWGSGKSSMIRLVRHALESGAEAEHKFLFVDFNAWLYQGYDDTRAALMEIIAQTLEIHAQQTSKGIDKATALLKRVNWLRVARLTAESAAAISLGLPPVGIIGEVFRLGHEITSRSADGTTVAGLGELVADIETTASNLLKAKPESSPPKEIQAIRNTFHDALEEMDITLVVLIDDLDRCLPETTISVLEAIRLFLFLERTAFVIAADDNMIRYAVSQHFSGLEDKDLVTSYFDKLIQVPIRVPPLGTQEARAYMMLLFIESSALEPDKKERIRVEVCKQLTKTWQGQRVDRSFIQSVETDLPVELLGQIDLAERLAPLMVGTSQINGNPRQIKRFLNTLSIRMSLARSQGVPLDEALVAKMLLFERCADTKLYQKLVQEVTHDNEGKPRFLTEMEAKARRGESATDGATSEWEKNRFVKEWLCLDPTVSDHDLRGAIYVGRENLPLITPEDRLSSAAIDILKALLSSPAQARMLSDRIKSLGADEVHVIMSRLLERARQEDRWGTPPILDACLEICTTFEGQGTRLAAFLISRPPAQIDASIIPKIQDQSWSSEVFEKWPDLGVSTRVKRAIKTLTEGLG